MTKKLVALLLAVALCVTALAGCGGNTAGNSKTDFAVNVGPEPNSIDPAMNTAVDGATMIITAFEGLTKLDKEHQVQLAQAAKIDKSDDGMVFTITLRDDIKWTDGQPVKAEDFIFAWQRAVNPELAAEYAYMFDPIKNAVAIQNGEMDPSELGAVAKDEKTIEITLGDPCTYFEELLAFPTYYPVRKDIVEANPEGWATEAETYVSNGPMKMVSWNHKENIVYERNEYYYDKDKLGPTKLTFMLSEDDNAILEAYKRGDILLADSMPNAEIPTWRDKEDFQTTKQMGTYFLCFQTQKEPFNDPKVRKALSLVIDRNYLVDKATKIGEKPAEAYVADSLFDADGKTPFREVGKSYWSNKEEDHAKNVEEAKRLLAEAGYPNGEGFPTFNYLYNPATPHTEVAEAIINMWQTELGITASASAQDWNVFIDTRNNGDFQVSRHGWLADYNDPVSFLDMWVTTSGNNNAKWSNAKYDQLIADVKSSNNQEERFKLMHEAEDIIMDEMPIAPLFYYEDLYLKSPKLEGFYDSPLGFKYFMYATVKE